MTYLDYVLLLTVGFLFFWLAMGSFFLQYPAYKMRTGKDAPSLVWARRMYKRVRNDLTRPIRRVL